MTRAVVLLVSLEVSGESLDLLRENSDLNFARSGVTVMALIFVTDGGFVELHCFYLSFLAFSKFILLLELPRPGSIIHAKLHHGAKEPSNNEEPAAGITS